MHGNCKFCRNMDGRMTMCILTCKWRFWIGCWIHIHGLLGRCLNQNINVGVINILTGFYSHESRWDDQGRRKNRKGMSSKDWVQRYLKVGEMRKNQPRKWEKVASKIERKPGEKCLRNELKKVLKRRKWSNVSNARSGKKRTENGLGFSDVEVLLSLQEQGWWRGLDRAHEGEGGEAWGQWARTNLRRA